MKNLLLPVTGTLAVFALVLAVFLWRQGRTIDGLHAVIVEAEAFNTRRGHAQQEAAREHERALRDAQDTIAQLRRELAVARAAAGLETDRERLSNDPAMVEFRKRQQRRIVQERYGDLFDRLSLSPIALEDFKRLLVELEDVDPAHRLGTGVASETNDGARRTFTAIHDEIYNLLGYEGYVTFDRYGRELISARPAMRRFANDAADVGHPLSAVQRVALSRTLFEVTDPQLNADAIKPGAKTPDPVTGLTPLDQQVLARATDILSSTQLELLRVFRIREREGLAAWREALSAPAEAPPVPAGDP